jgi:class 3 adenylate cyclase/tetratricopeptide (TPR) repeat protein
MIDTDEDEALGPYVPELVIDWLRESPQASHRTLNGTLALIDISGFTQLTERFARVGKVGAEEMSQILDAVFASLLDVAYGYGADLIKWGGDAVLLLYQGAGHAAAACAATQEMRKTLRHVGKVTGTAGSATLRMSAGLDSGEIMFFLVGSRHREIIIVGPVVTHTAMMQAAAEAGQVAIGPGTAALLDPGLAGARVGPGYILGAVPKMPLRPVRRASVTGLGLARFLSPPVAEYLLAGGHEGEHRRVTVAFVEFSGTDRLLAVGSVDALVDALQHLITSAQDAAHAHGVALFGADISADGGKLMLVAGAPRSAGHDETHLLRAVRAVLDWSGALTLRAGAHVGRVFAGDLGPAYRRTYSVWGDPINLAARLMTRAKPGQLLATAEILDRSTKAFAFGSLPPFRVKGKAQQVHAFEVGAPLLNRRAPGRPSGRLAGRDAEVAVLREALDSLRRGRGGAVELVGEPGIGKSRLLAELLALAGHMRRLVVRCDDYASAIPWAVSEMLLRDLLGVPAEAEPQAVVAALSAAVAEHAPQLEKWLPLLAAVVGAELPPTPEVAQLADAFRRPRLEQALIDLVGDILQEPAVLALEDVQFADEASVSVLSRLLGEAARRPWLVVITGSARASVPAPENAEPLRLTLGPLSDAAAEILLLDATERLPLAPHQLAAIVERGAGNPLFLRELATVAGHGGDVMVLPESVEDVIGVQIDLLAAADRSTLRAAAVAGMSFEEGLLAEALGHPLDAGVWKRLQGFVSAEPGGGFRFRHALLRDAAYEGLPYARRRQIHRQLAAALERRAGGAPQTEAAQLSLHHFHAQSYRAASYYARIAGERAAAAYANPEAARFLATALEAARQLTSPQPEEVSRLAEALGDIRYRLGEFASAGQCFAEARRLSSDDPVALARLCLKLALIAERTGGFPQALHWINIGRRAVQGLADPDALREDARLVLRTAVVRYMQGRFAAAIKSGQQAMAEAERSGAKDVLAGAYQLLDAADVALGNFGGEPWAQRSLAIWEELGDLNRQGRVLNELGVRAYFEGRWDDALGYYRQAEDAYKRVGDQWNEALTACNIAEILSNQGRYTEAEDMVRPAERVLRASGALSETAFADAVLGRTAARLGRPAEASRLLEAARAGYLKAQRPTEVVATEITIAETLMYAGEAEQALSRTDDIAASSPARENDASASALARVRGCALALLDYGVTAYETVEASLRAARARADRYDEALAIDALIRLAEIWGQPAEPGLVASRDELFRMLGIVATPDLPAGSEIADTRLERTVRVPGRRGDGNDHHAGLGLVPRRDARRRSAVRAVRKQSLEFVVGRVERRCGPVLGGERRRGAPADVEMRRAAVRGLLHQGLRQHHGDRFRPIGDREAEDSADGGARQTREAAAGRCQQIARGCRAGHREPRGTVRADRPGLAGLARLALHTPGNDVEQLGRGASRLPNGRLQGEAETDGAEGQVRERGDALHRIDGIVGGQRSADGVDRIGKGDRPVKAVIQISLGVLDIDHDGGRHRGLYLRRAGLNCEGEHARARMGERSGCRER